MLKYKCEIVGINVITHEESYTSKCSFLDLEEIKKHETYKGKRIKRGLFKSLIGTLINADVNGSYNILRKAIPNAFAEGIEGVEVHPIDIISIK
jgi:putative transposase